MAAGTKAAWVSDMAALVRSAALASVLAAFMVACSSPAPTTLDKADSADNADGDDDSSSDTPSKSTTSKSSSKSSEPTKSTTSSQTAPTTNTPAATTPTTTTPATNTGGGLLDSLPFKLSDLLGLLQGGGNNNGGFDLGGLLGGLFGGNGGDGAGLDLGGNAQNVLADHSDQTGCCVGTQFFICGANATTCSDASQSCERSADLDDVCAQ